MMLDRARDAGSLFDKQAPTDQARLLRALPLNCTFARGILCLTYASPLDLCVKRNETGDCLGGRESRSSRYETQTKTGLFPLSLTTSAMFRSQCRGGIHSDGAPGRREGGEQRHSDERQHA